MKNIENNIFSFNGVIVLHYKFAFRYMHGGEELVYQIIDENELAYNEIECM